MCSAEIGVSSRPLARHVCGLGDLADDQKSHTTVERYLQILNNRLIPRWAKTPALNIQPLDVMQWSNASKREEKLKNPTVG